MRLIKHGILGILSNAVALYIASMFVEGMTLQGELWKTLLIGGLFLGILNTLIKPVLKLFSLPFILLTAGLFYFALNAAILWILVHLLDILAFQEVAIIIGGWIEYIFAGFIVAIINMVLHWLTR